MSTIYIATIITLELSKAELDKRNYETDINIVEEPEVIMTTNYDDLSNLIIQNVIKVSECDDATIKKEVENMNCFRFNVRNIDCSEIISDTMITIKEFVI